MVYLEKRNENIYYVYGLFIKNDNPIDNCFYIGRGKYGRMFHHFSRAKNSCVSKTIKSKKELCYPRRLITNLDEEKSIKLEKQLINEIGLNNICNKELGGDGRGGRNSIPMSDIDLISWNEFRNS